MMSSIKIKWEKCIGGVWGNCWCSFLNVHLDELSDEGVYIIWHDGAYNGEKSQIIYVGKGNVADRIDKHRTDSNITKYQQKGNIYFTWAMISPDKQGGVENYLAHSLTPLEGKIWSDDEPITVNLPWY